MENNRQTIDFGKIFKDLWSRKMLLLKVWVVTFILACIYIFPQPRYYDASEVLAPEIVDLSSSGGLGALASNFGVNLGIGMSKDAIYPELYPDLIGSKQFLVSLFDVKVKTLDGKVECDLHTYLLEHQKDAFYNYPKTWLIEKISEWKNSDKPVGKADGKIDPFILSEQDMLLTKTLEGMIRCSVNKKTDVVTISIRSQDPLVSATLADSVCQRLQTVITDYRTSKARMDVEYYTKLTEKAKADYDRSVVKYSHFCDTHESTVLQVYASERDKLENEMSMCFSTYQTMQTQLQAAKAKLQERTPVFTILQCSTVPIRPAGPRRMIFVIAMLFLATVCTTLYVGRSEFKKAFAAR